MKNGENPPRCRLGNMHLDYIAFLASYGRTGILEGFGTIIKVVPVEIK